MEYTSLSWNDVQLHEHRLYEFCYPLSNLCHKWTVICLVCADCRSFHLYLLMTIWHHVWHMTSCWHQQHDEWCRSWIKISKLCTSGWKFKNVKTMKETFLIRDNFNFPFICNNIPAAPADGVYVSSLSWSDIQLHKDRLHDFCYPLSRPCPKWTLICLVCTDCRSFHLSLLMTFHHVWFDQLLVSAAWWMPIVWQDLS